MGDDDVSNNRVTTREFYEAQLKTIELIHSIKDELMAEIKPVAKLCNQVETNKKEIDRLRNRSNLIDVANGIIAIIASTIAGVIGSKAP